MRRIGQHRTFSRIMQTPSAHISSALRVGLRRRSWLDSVAVKPEWSSRKSGNDDIVDLQVDAWLIEQTGGERELGESSAAFVTTHPTKARGHRRARNLAASKHHPTDQSSVRPFGGIWTSSIASPISITVAARSHSHVVTFANVVGPWRHAPPSWWMWPNR
jgi:hypothetical protein